MTGDLPFLEVHELTKQFGGVVAVDHVDIRVKAGELRCLIGPNGAGKTTFFRCLSGQLRPDRGHVRFRGMDITRVPPHAVARQNIAIKTQIPALFEGLSARENIWLATWRTGGRTARLRRVDTILELTGLAPQASQPAQTLAHGQRQWLDLGLALAGDPALLLLDEPTAGMTRDEVKRTMDLVNTLRQERTIIVIEHDLEFVRLVADSVTALHQGRILAEGPAETVLKNRTVREVYLGEPAGAGAC